MAKNINVTGVKIHTSHPQISSYAAPTDDKEYAPKKYGDDKGAIFEISTLFETLTRFKVFDNTGGAMVEGGLKLVQPVANRTQGVEIENLSAFKVFGGGNTVEMNVLVTISGNASQRNNNGYIVVGDLTGAAAVVLRSSFVVV